MKPEEQWSACDNPTRDIDDDTTWHWKGCKDCAYWGERQLIRLDLLDHLDDNQVRQYQVLTNMIRRNRDEGNWLAAETTWLHGRDAGAKGQPVGTIETSPYANGVWVVYWHDIGPHIHSVHATEIEARRTAEEWHSCDFLAFGANIQEALG